MSEKLEQFVRDCLTNPSAKRLVEVACESGERIASLTAERDRLAGEVEERAKAFKQVLWAIAAAKEFAKQASETDHLRSEYWEARCDAADDMRDAITSLAHLDEKGTDDGK